MLILANHLHHFLLLQLIKTINPLPQLEERTNQPILNAWSSRTRWPGGSMPR
uniref:Uncharacterized protein n=1 Tax=Arundo donax TaxID=35708 RepID=A0A0A8ZRE2_ARUDO